jgi:putative ABC transport system permease protein
MTGMMTTVLAGIAAISLVVGGIGIMNIMLVSVTERTREIGIRKAIGAKKKNILVQFLIEAIIVTGIGGILGVLIGVSIIHFIIGGLDIVPEVYSIPWILISFNISLFVGVIFGLFPAFKAASLNPIEALRAE